MACVNNILVFGYIGLLRAVGKELFHTEVKAEVIDIQNEATELEARRKANEDDTSESSDYSQMRYKEHVTFRVTLNDKVTQYKQKVKAEELENKNGTTDLSLVPMKNIDFNLSYPESSYISPRNFCTVFPYHVIFDSNLLIKQCGVQLQKCCPYIVEQDVKLMDIFSIAQPKMPLTFEHILRFINATFILELRGFMLDNGVKTVNAKGILLKGRCRKAFVFLQYGLLTNLMFRTKYNLHPTSSWVWSNQCNRSAFPFPITIFILMFRTKYNLHPTMYIIKSMVEPV